jgi:hypothetical protein
MSRPHNVNVAADASGLGAGGFAEAESHFGMLMSEATNLGTVGTGTASVQLTSVPTSSGGSCLVAENADGGQGGSCLDTPSLFTSRPVAFLEESDGGPDPASINYVRVVGVVKPGVDSVGVQLSSGTTESIAVTSAGAFEYEEPVSSIHAGDLPAKLIVHQGGEAVGTYALYH